MAVYLQPFVCGHISSNIKCYWMDKMFDWIPWPCVKFNTGILHVRVDTASYVLRLNYDKWSIIHLSSLSSRNLHFRRFMIILRRGFLLDSQLSLNTVTSTQGLWLRWDYLNGHMSPSVTSSHLSCVPVVGSTVAPPLSQEDGNEICTSSLLTNIIPSLHNVLPNPVV